MPDDIRVAGAAQADANFNGGSDVITYHIDMGMAGRVSFEAVLKYQTLGYAFVNDLKSRGLLRFTTMPVFVPRQSHR